MDPFILKFLWLLGIWLLYFSLAWVKKWEAWIYLRLSPYPKIKLFVKWFARVLRKIRDLAIIDFLKDLFL